MSMRVFTVLSPGDALLISQQLAYAAEHYDRVRVAEDDGQLKIAVGNQTWTLGYGDAETAKQWQDRQPPPHGLDVIAAAIDYCHTPKQDSRAVDAAGRRLYATVQFYVAVPACGCHAGPVVDHPPAGIVDTCCGKCPGGTCYVDQVTGA